MIPPSGLPGLAAAGVLREHVPLAPLTTYRFGGPARWMLDAESEADVVRLAEALGEEPERVPVIVLGRGSNVVISDAGFPGVVIRPGSGLAGIDLRGDGTVAAGAAAALPMVARRTAEAGRGGLEFFVGIPGSVGGAVCMNAGCHGSETAQWLRRARIVDLAAATVGESTPADLEMSYRHSTVRAHEVVVSAVFDTVLRPRAEAEARIREITRWRRDHQPGGTLNAGSVFKNPEGDAAGRIIDACGLKGYRVGGVSVSERHANFFVAGEGATAADLHRLVHRVRALVEERCGVVLTPEIRFVGPFAAEGE